MLYATRYASPVGLLTLTSDGDSLVGLRMDGQKYFSEAADADVVEKDDLPLLLRARAWLDAYFAGEQPDCADVPLAPVGSAFRQGVWDILRAIPYGSCVTYGAVAREMAVRMGRERMSSQAVGGAVGHNPLPIIIPCHRVVGANGSLTGYGGGLSRKISLLRHEGVDVSRFFTPVKGSAL